MDVTRLTFKLTLISALIFAAIIALIRAQPYDDSQLREFLTPLENCPMPCFMGIHPGVTTGEEALQMLQNHEWVEEITFVNYQEVETRRNISSIQWVWSSRTPEFISRDYRASVGIDLSDNTVTYIEMDTFFTIGDIWLVLGAPDEYWITTVSGLIDSDPANMAYVFTYTHQKLWVYGYAGCFYAHNMWQPHAHLSLTKDNGSPPMEGPYINFSTFVSRTYAFQHMFCKR